MAESDFEKIVNTSLQSIVIENANHSLETGDVERDILNLQKIMVKSKILFQDKLNEKA